MNWEMVIFIAYFIFMIGIGLYFFFKPGRNGGDKDYFLGGRQMGAWVSALSAGASDMSAWVLMGLPASIFAAGMGQTWIAIGLLIGYILSWIFEAPRLRRFSIRAKDSITIPQYLTNRFLSASKALQVLCAVIFLVAYTVYAASSIKACGTLFNTVMNIPAETAMYIAAFIIIGYTFLGGFSAVCWTDFFQGMLMLAALLVAPIFALALVENPVQEWQLLGNAGFFNFTSSWQDIVSGLGWGLGYFGMPHIIVRFMSIRSQKELKKSRVIGISWTAIILLMSVAVATIGKMFLGEIADTSTVFIQMVRKIFPPVLAGICLSAILAASMSTADSQLLASASAFASDLYKPIIRKDRAGDKEMLWVSRIVVIAIAVAALFIAKDPNSGTIMGLVENAWGVFGAAFGPAILLSLFWKRFNFPGAVAGIAAGAAADILWLVVLKSTGIYEIVPGFLIGLLVAVLVSLCTNAPSEEVKALFDEAVASEE